MFGDGLQILTIRDTLQEAQPEGTVRSWLLVGVLSVLVQL